MTNSFFNFDDVILLLAIFGWVGFIGTSIYIYQARQKKRYQKPLRLVDVIRLINALALESNDFKTELSIVDALRGKPRSAKTWHEIAEEHPEFFRPNYGSSHYALTARSYLPVEPNKPRPTLALADTQKLYELAITFHEKEVQQSQRYILWFPLITAILASITLLINSLITNQITNKNISPAVNYSKPASEKK